MLCGVRAFRVRVCYAFFAFIVVFNFFLLEVFMRRSRLSRGGSKRLFRNRSGVHPKNTRAVPMRGGIRL